MPHDFLNDFQVRLILAKPCAECMPQIVDAEMRQQHGLSLFLLRLLCFLKIAVSYDSVDHSVDCMRRQHFSIAVLEHKV